MNTLLIGDMKRVDGFWEWLNAADEVFEVSLIISEDEMVSENFHARFSR